MPREKRAGRAELVMAAPATQNAQVDMTQRPCTPSEAHGVVDQTGCMNSTVKTPPVMAVQQEQNLRK